MGKRGIKEKGKKGEMDEMDVPKCFLNGQRKNGKQMAEEREKNISKFLKQF